MTQEVPGPRPLSEENIFSLEDLDKIIEAEDPLFKEVMEGIKTAGADAKIDIESIDVDGDDENVNPDRDKNRGLTKKEKFVASVHKFILYTKQKYKHYLSLTKNRTLSAWTATLSFIRNELPDRLRYHRSQIKVRFNKIILYFKNEYIRFKSLNNIEKTGLLFVIAASFFSILFLSKTYTGTWLPHFSDPLLHSLESEATLVKTYKDKGDQQNLFQAFPETEIYVLLTKVIVNLKSDKNSSPNPMGIYELYLGLDSKDTAVEVKQREREILDLIQRSLEPFSYTEVSSQVGKVRMKSAVRNVVNTILNQGQVMQVYFNTFVTKP